ncbi:MAG: ABC transporter permease subunit [Anaerolineae bacterium]|nr:ABC transporter permease subunit [Anaerolineae bacterium]
MPPWLWSRRQQTAALERGYAPGQPHRPVGWADVIVILAVAVIVYAGVRLAFQAPDVIRGPSISLQPQALPWYALLSLGRMLSAYVLSLLFALVYGRAAARNRLAETVLMPALDVLQSVPILSFLPVVLLSLSAVLPIAIATELASIVLIFTSQAWNLIFAWYQSLTTIPRELDEASSVFRLSTWQRIKTLELPFSAPALIWNSMMSWAGGWFFLMAAEILTVGQRDFRLPGLGAYLQEAAHQGDLVAIAWGVATLVLLIVALDQLVWRPLLAWADKFGLETVTGETRPSSWFLHSLHRSRIAAWAARTVLRPLIARVDSRLERLFPHPDQPATVERPRTILVYGLTALAGAVLAYGVFRSGQVLVSVPAHQWAGIGIGAVSTLARVSAALVIALLWTVPLGVAIGTNRSVATFLQPVVQIAASIPATALFPAVLLLLLRVPSGLEFAAILLMLAGSQWYLLFNIVAGASAIPEDLRYTASLLQLRGADRWRTLVLPALFPYIITGAITATGGAWNASIVAEYVTFAGQTAEIGGIGAVIAGATSQGDYPLLLAGTMSMIVTVVLINRLLWRRLYRLAEERYRME